MKSGKKTVGMTAKRKHTPAVKARLTTPAFLFFFRTSGFSDSSLRARIASRGIVNSAITSIDATVLNFAYIGM